eukprot:1384323-Rhodomonas_salina.1
MAGKSGSHIQLAGQTKGPPPPQKKLAVAMTCVGRNGAAGGWAEREVLSAYAFSTRCPAMSGTDIAYAATTLRPCYAMSGSDVVMSGPGTAYGTICVRTSYAMSGTDLPFLRTRYSMSGTDMAYGPILYALLNVPTHSLREARYSHTECPYALATRSP